MINSEQILADGETLTISSPDYPRVYPNNAYELWDIRAPEGMKLHFEPLLFDLRISDNLYLGDDIDSFSTACQISCPWKSLGTFRI